MKNRLAALAGAALALVALSGCTGAAPDAANPTPMPNATNSAGGAQTPTPSGEPASEPTGEPRFTTPAGVVVPEGFVEATKGLFAESDPAATFEGAQYLCLILNDLDGDMEQASGLMKSDMGMTPEQTRTLLPLAVEFACPGWADNYNAWVDGGGLDRV